MDTVFYDDFYDTTAIIDSIDNYGQGIICIPGYKTLSQTNKYHVSSDLMHGSV